MIGELRAASQCTLLKKTSPRCWAAATQALLSLRSTVAFKCDKCWHMQELGRAGRHVLTRMVIETWWCSWLFACCGLLGSRWLINLTCMAFCYRARTPGPGMRGLFTECQGGIVSLHRKEIQEAHHIYLFIKSHEHNDVTVGDQCLCAGTVGLKIHILTGRYTACLFKITIVSKTTLTTKRKSQLYVKERNSFLNKWESKGFFFSGFFLLP